MQNEVLRFPTGAGIDYRTEEQKAKDWRPEEAFASASPVMWKEKTIEEIEADIKAHSISQGSTSRCVSEYAGIALEMAERAESGLSVIFSRRDIYCRRVNRPQEGMGMADLFKLMREGACLESQLPSTDVIESEINKPYAVTDEMIKARATYASGSSFTWAQWTMDDIARMIDQGTPVCLFWFFDDSQSNEWWKEKPAINRSMGVADNGTARHQATAINYCMIGGEEHLVVMDSAGQGTGAGVQRNIRFVSESFFKVRCYGAGFTIDKKNLDYKPDTGFTYNFTRNLSMGSTGDDVEALQKILVLEGCLVLKTPTKLYAGMTHAGVKKLQEKYAKEILAPLGLKIGTGNFANATRAFINAKYNH